MPKRLTDSELWDKQWFMDLKPKYKCLVKFVRDKCDFIGFWKPNFVLASQYIGEKVIEADLLKVDGGRQFRKMADGKIYCSGFIEFQYGDIEKEPPPPRKKSSMHIKILEELAKRGFNFKTLKFDCKHPVDTVSANADTVQEMVMVKEQEERQEQEQVKEEPEKKHRYQQMIIDGLFTNIQKMKTQLTYAEAVKLEIFGDDIVEEVFNSMDNKPTLTTDYSSVYRTALDWCKRRKKNEPTVIKFNHGSHQRTLKPTGTASSAVIEEGRDFGSL